MRVEWLFAIFMRILHHDNMQVKKFGVLYILRLDYNSFPEFTSNESLPVSFYYKNYSVIWLLSWYIKLYGEIFLLSAPDGFESS